MTGCTAILRREVWRRRQLFLLAAAFATLAFAMPWLPGLGHHPPTELRAVTSAVLALLLGPIVGIIAGIGLAGRDLTENRFGFDFARPVSGLAIWAGRLGAGIVVIAGGELITLLPALRGQLDPSIRLNGPVEVGGAALLYLGLPILLMLLVHAVGIAVRARTPWLALDAFGVLGFVAAAWFGVRAFLLDQQREPLVVVGLAVLAALAAALLVASLFQIVLGRSALPDGHRWLSSSGWTTLALAMVAVIAYSSWLWHVEPGDLRAIRVGEVSPNGSRFVLFGADPRRWNLTARFIVDSTDGRSIRLVGPGGTRRYRRSIHVEFSDDSSRALLASDRDGQEALRVMRLDDDRWGEVREVAVVDDDTWHRLSPTGSTLLIRRGGVLLGIDTETGETLSGFKLESLGQDPGKLRFRHYGTSVSNDVLRLVDVARRGEPTWRITVNDWNVRTDENTIIAAFRLGWCSELELSEDGRTLEVAWRGRNERVRLTCDIATLDCVVLPRNQQPPAAVRTLADGRTVRVVDETDDRKRLELLDSSGTVLHSYPVPKWLWLPRGLELLPGQLLVINRAREETGVAGSLAMLDVETGTFEAFPHRVWPAPGDVEWGRWNSYDRDLSANAIHLFTTRDDRVVRWDPETESMVPVPGFEPRTP